MNRTFRLRKHYLYTGVGCGLFFCVMLVVFVACAAQKQQLMQYLLVTSIGIGFLLLSAYLVASYWVHRLDIAHGRIERRTLFTWRTLVVDGQLQLTWRRWPKGGSVVVWSPLVRIPVDFANYECNQKIAMIEHFRNSSPEHRQTGWDDFCQRWALPLVEPERPPSNDTQHITRWNVDRLFAVAMLPQLLITLTMVWIDGPRHWFSIVVVPAFWLVHRFVIPMKGIKATKVSHVPGIKWWLIYFSTMILGFYLRAWMEPLGIACWVVSAAAFVRFFRLARAEERRKLAQLQELARTADQRWRALRAANLAH